MTATEAATEAATTAAVDSSSDDAVQTLVKAYIDAGTCGQITTGDSCGDSAESYYSEFEYNGRRVVIANGIPNHDAEHDQYFVNPNTRCERYHCILCRLLCLLETFIIDGLSCPFH